MQKQITATDANGNKMTFRVGDRVRFDTDSNLGVREDTVRACFMQDTNFTGPSKRVPALLLNNHAWCYADKATKITTKDATPDTTLKPMGGVVLPAIQKAGFDLILDHTLGAPVEVATTQPAPDKIERAVKLVDEALKLMEPIAAAPPQEQLVAFERMLAFINANFDPEVKTYRIVYHSWNSRSQRRTPDDIRQAARNDAPEGCLAALIVMLAITNIKVPVESGKVPEFEKFTKKFWLYIPV